MSEIELLKDLSGNTYKIYRYITLRANNQGILWGITREDIEKDLNLGYTTVYAGLRELKEKEYIEYNGAKQYAKILPLH